MELWFEPGIVTTLLSGIVTTSCSVVTRAIPQPWAPPSIASHTTPHLRVLPGGQGCLVANLHVCLPPSQLALDYGIKFMETSAKANINVENVSPRPTAPTPLG